MNATRTILLALLLVACSAAGDRADRPVSAPLTGIDSGYRAAARVPLPAAEPELHPGLENLFRLSPNVISGGEPQTEAAFEELAELGVRTILSVDGKVPDVAAAERWGLRTVHVPIQYRGIAPEELLRISKTFRELEPPFYVHCFHGRHRGPTAAAVGRLVLDGVSRERALAEMRQWCQASEKYEGLYATVATGAIPDSAASAACRWDFGAAAPLGDLRAVMVDAARAFDNLQQLAPLDFGVDPEHPDIAAGNEAEQLQQALLRSLDIEGLFASSPNARAWLAESAQAAAELRGDLDRLTGGESDAGARARGALTRIGGLCKSCHQATRNR